MKYSDRPLIIAEFKQQTLTKQDVRIVVSDTKSLLGLCSFLVEANLTFASLALEGPVWQDKEPAFLYTEQKAKDFDKFAKNLGLLIHTMELAGGYETNQETRELWVKLKPALLSEIISQSPREILDLAKNNNIAWEMA